MTTAWLQTRLRTVLFFITLSQALTCLISINSNKKPSNKIDHNEALELEWVPGILNPIAPSDTVKWQVLISPPVICRRQMFSRLWKKSKSLTEIVWHVRCVHTCLCIVVLSDWIFFQRQACVHPLKEWQRILKEKQRYFVKPLTQCYLANHLSYNEASTNWFT